MDKTWTQSSWTRLSDLDLVHACAREEQEALTALHGRHAALCRHRALTVLRNPALAEEAVQDAFLDLWKTARSFDAGRSGVLTWLCVLVHRRAVDVARREARHHLQEETASPPDPASYTAEELVILQFDRRRVRKALDQLGTVHRQVIDLAYWGGLSQSQIAAHCAVPVGTIKSRTFDALTQLAALLASADDGAHPLRETTRV
jgi:RNA polymerase sigma-70 factor (ECF subfamily)